jgi:N-acetylneuraminic acid mutarotase
MPTPRAGGAAAVVDGLVVVAGGEGNAVTGSGVFSEVEAFDASVNRWSSLPPMETPRHGMGAAAYDGVFYVPGGATRQGFGAVSTHEALRVR